MKDKIIKYLAGTALLVVPLIVGYFFNEQKLAGIIIGVVYGFWLPVLVFCIWLIPSAPDLTKSMHSVFWDFPFMSFIFFLIDIFMVCIVFYLGYHKISLCMIMEILLNISIAIICREVNNK